MDLAAIEEEKQETSFMERFMFALIPFLFVAVLLAVLLTLLDKDIRNSAIEVGQKIPVVRSLLPEPETTGTDETVRTEKQDTKIAELEAKITELQAQLSDATSTTTEQEETISTLQSENEELKQNTSDNNISDDEYRARIGELASMFSKMQPSKAAPIMQAMTHDEMALIFSQMRADDRVRIMEKMTPQIAADVTLKLKDQDSVNNMEIAALQSQIKKLQDGGNTSGTSSQVTDADLARTFAAMDSSAASDMLLKMMEISSSKVLRILKATDSTTRSAILEKMAETDNKTSATLVTKLMQDS